MDFVEGLPPSGSANALLVVVGKLSKYAHFIPLRHPFTTTTVARLFMDNIYRLHGMPLVIISDHDCVFTSALWKTFFSLSDTSLRMSSAYHPQIDRQTERVNQCLETYLHCFAHACPPNGFSGSLSSSSGTTLLLIPHWAALPSKYCMGFLLGTSALLHLR
jgi:hypothetical protein